MIFQTNSSIVKLLQIASIAFLSLGCNEDAQRSLVKIEFVSNNLDSAHIEIFKYNLLSLEPISLIKTKLDSMRSAKVNIEISKPIFVTLKINNKSVPVYLEPGFDFKVYFDDTKNSLNRYEGRGSLTNKYLSNVALIKRVFEGDDKNSIYSLDTKPFLIKLDSLQDSLINYHRAFMDSFSLREPQASLLKKRNEIVALAIKQTYGFNYGTQHQFQIPLSLSINNDIPLDSILLKTGIKEYAEIWHILMHLNYYIPLWANKELEQEKTIKKGPLLIKAKIEINEYPPFIKEFLFAKNIDHWMGSIGVPPLIDTLYKEFINNYPTSDYTNTLDSYYKKWINISPGQPAPNIIGIDLNDSVFNLGDLKGKIVYIDVWATWCAPCIAEHPSSRKLQEHFSGNDKVAFLYVSVDKNKEKWRKAITQKESLIGIHINNDGSIFNSYLINGVPKFILINKEGLIENTDAPRPSTGKVENLIEILLDEN